MRLRNVAIHSLILLSLIVIIFVIADLIAGVCLGQLLPNGSFK